jgi:antirestriction protein ArdC
VRKGEESSIVTFWKVEDAKPTEDLGDDEPKEKTRRRFLLKLYRVFNLEQCDLPQAVIDKLPKIETHQQDPIESAERIIAEMPNPPEIEYAGSKAFYSVASDRITIPPRSLFESVEEFYGTLDHEIIHYADFRIMPRLMRGAACIMGHVREMSA